MGGGVIFQYAFELVSGTFFLGCPVVISDLAEKELISVFVENLESVESVQCNLLIANKHSHYIDEELTFNKFSR